MGIINLVQKEIFFRKFSFSVALLSVTIAVSTLTGAYTLLKIHDIRTDSLRGKTNSMIKFLLSCPNSALEKIS